MSVTGALYRKYRPQYFAEVKDQDHIVTVLEGAIKKGEIPHAMLFSGTRGTGKTTLARIFAKAIGTSDLDMYEIDAASNRGIDDVRELKEAVHTLPYESTHKVYIIDEVHMLTKEAFNALLKTLEEPPAHVVFILATTEEEKLLDTILSRCQVFRMHSPSRAVLAEFVTETAKKEGFKLNPDAADLIAIAADGSFRDALGVTQKVIMASGDKIGDADEVASIIGAPKVAIIQQLLEGLHTKNKAEALEAVSLAVEAGVDMKLFARVVLEHVRAVMLLRNLPARKEIILNAFGIDTQTKLETYASEVTPLNSHLLLQLIKAADLVSRSPIPQAPLEIVIIEVTG
ncbi:DNA polymerase III subunit gamma/tau [Candidatus Nomurabacteria bacterium]|nr:DNA polymerase III subunit gamma/tau [Candidatus Kaiserbacteria bacterium]MCB9815268.1 DNA polymerase III subunit gamma/tau [Candidatus Nomurabacteria bacterium]